MPRMIAAKRFEYARKVLYAGQDFDVAPKDEKILRAAGLALDTPVAGLALDIPVMDAAPVKPMDTQDADALVPYRRGRYSRRDMRATEFLPRTDEA